MGKKKLTKEERDIFTELVFIAKANHNRVSLLRMNLNRLTGIQIKAEITGLAHQDKCLFNLAVAIQQAGIPPPRIVFDNYDSLNNIGLLMNKLTTKQKTVDVYNYYFHQLETYEEAIRQRDELYKLARNMYDNELGILRPLIDDYIHTQPPIVLSTGQVIQSPSGLSSLLGQPTHIPSTLPTPLSTPVRSTNTGSLTASATSGTGLHVVPIIKNIGSALGKPYEVAGLNPFNLGYSLGHDVIAPELQKAMQKGNGLLHHEHILKNGKYYLNKRNLKNNILELRYTKNRHLVSIKPQMISNVLKDMIMDILDGDDMVDEKKFAKLNDTEKHLFRSITKYFDIDGGDLPDVSDDMDAKAQIVFGEIRAGNDNPDLKKSAYRYLHHAYLIGKLKNNDFNSLVRQYSL